MCWNRARGGFLGTGALQILWSCFRTKSHTTRVVEQNFSFLLLKILNFSKFQKFQNEYFLANTSTGLDREYNVIVIPSISRAATIL